MPLENPYATAESSEEHNPLSAASVTLAQTARQIFLAWERQRPVYNGVVATVACTMSLLDLHRTVASVRFWVSVIIGGVFANICYLAAPLLETYATWLGYRGSLLRTVLFILGTLLTLVLAMAVVAAHMLPGMD